MSSAEIRINGLRELQKKLTKAKERIEETLGDQLMWIAEEAATHAKENKGYKDHSANLKNSITPVLYKDGKPLFMGANGVTTEAKAECENNVTQFAEANAEPQGYTLMIVAGMRYGKYVEDKGYNVLHLTKYFLQDRLREAIEEVIEDVNNSDL